MGGTQRGPPQGSGPVRPGELTTTSLVPITLLVSIAIFFMEIYKIQKKKKKTTKTPKNVSLRVIQ